MSKEAWMVTFIGYFRNAGIDSKGLGLLVLGELLNIGSMTNMGHGAIELRMG